MTTRCKKRMLVGLSLLAGLVLAPAAGAQALTDAHGIHVVAERRLDARLVELTVTTAALAKPARVRVLLPAGYGGNPRRRYPVLYLLHGTSGGAADWTTMGDSERVTQGRPLIVVMPDIALGDDGGGWCTNWYNGGAHGRPKWETFHIEELIPWVDRNLRTIPSRAGRAIAGLSQGGFCSMSYAARHPDLFVTALAFSGAPDTAYDSEARALVTPVILATETGLDRVPPNSMFGPRATQEINWAAHDPTTLADNLRGIDLLMFTGDGRPGPLDAGIPSPGAMAIEAGVQQLTELFHNRLGSLGIPSFYEAYGPGTHSWPYWARDLRESIGRIVADFAHPPPAPRQITYTSAEAAYSVFGWRVEMHRRVAEFSTLRDARSTGFTLEGSGNATVRTPGRYRPRGRYTVAIRTAGGAKVMQTARADHAGRLRIEVPLGPSDTVQEYSVAGSNAGTTVFATRVTIVPEAGLRAHR